MSKDGKNKKFISNQSLVMKLREKYPKPIKVPTNSQWIPFLWQIQNIF